MKFKHINPLSSVMLTGLLMATTGISSIVGFNGHMQAAIADEFECNDAAIGTDRNIAEKTRQQNDISLQRDERDQTTELAGGFGSNTLATGDSGKRDSMTDKSVKETEKRIADRVVRGKNCDNANNNRSELERRKIQAEEDNKRHQSMDDFFKGF